MKLNKFFLVALAAVFAFASCAKDGGSDIDKPIYGKATKMEIQLQFDKAPGAYAEHTVGESTITGNVIVLIFNGNQLEKSLASALTGDKTVVIPITAGAKRVFVLANKPAAIDLSTLVEGKPADPVAGTPAVTGTLITAFEKMVLKNPELSLMAVTTDAAFFMANLKTPAATVLEANVLNPETENKNIVTVKVARLTAKIMPKFTATAATMPMGTLEAVEFKLGNIAQHSYLVGQFDAVGNIVTPYFDGLSGVVVTPPNMFYDDYMAVGPRGYQAVDGTLAAFAFDNSNVEAKEGNTTRLVVKGNFRPALALSFDKDEVALVTPIAAATTFYTIKKSNGTIVFCNTLPVVGEPMFDNNPGATIVTHLLGLSYYHSWITGSNPSAGASAKEYTIARNNLYKLSISAITGPGAGDESTLITDPITPIEKETNMVVSVEVLDWVIIDQEIPL